MFGQKARLPFGFSPVALQKMVCEDGEKATSNVASYYGIPMAISTLTTVPLEVLCSDKQGIRYLQSFIFKDEVITDGIVRAAERNGIKALVITVDAQVLGNRLSAVLTRGAAVQVQLGPAPASVRALQRAHHARRQPLLLPVEGRRVGLVGGLGPARQDRPQDHPEGHRQPHRRSGGSPPRGRCSLDVQPRRPPA